MEYNNNNNKSDDGFLGVMKDSLGSQERQRFIEEAYNVSLYRAP